MAAARNPKLVFNVYKTNCGTKIQKIENFMATYMGDLNEKKVRELDELNTAIKDQFARMELAWDNTMNGVTDGADFTE